MSSNITTNKEGEAPGDPFTNEKNMPNILPPYKIVMYGLIIRGDAPSEMATNKHT